MTVLSESYGGVTMKWLAAESLLVEGHPRTLDSACAVARVFTLQILEVSHG